MFYCTSIAEEIPGFQKDTNNGAIRHTLCVAWQSCTMHLSELQYSCTQQVTVNM